MNRTVPLLAALGLLALSGSGVRATPPALERCDRFVAQTLNEPRTGWTSVIVRYDRAPSRKQESALAALGGDIYRRLPLIRAVAVRVPRRNLARLTTLPGVARISGDVSVRKTDAFTVGATGADTAYASYGLTGAGVGVAVLDSGIYFHKDLTNGRGTMRISASVSFTGRRPWNDDECGHGTHVAGIIAGNGLSSSGKRDFQSFYGIAREANLVDVQVLDRQGMGTVSDVIRGIQWCVENRSAYNIRVMNLSLGHTVGESYRTDPLCQAVESAWKSGIVVVCAAGNGGRLHETASSSLDNEGWGSAYGSIQSPGNDPYVITVGALKRSASGPRVATYSSRGPSRLDFVLKPDIVAPGNRIVSLDVDKSYLETTFSSTNLVPASEYTKNGSGAGGSKYFVLSGTSMAAPVAAGAAALLLQRDPTLDPDTIKARLMVSATKGNDLFAWGAGLLNIPAALESPVRVRRPALSPRLIHDLSGYVRIDPADLFQGDQVIWGDLSLRSAQILWGTQVVWGEGTQLFGDQVIWGDGWLRGSQVVWGTRVWADQVVWGEVFNAVDLTVRAILGDP